MAESIITIQAPDGKDLYTAPVTSACKRVFMLMQQDSITLKFSDKRKLNFPIGCRIGEFYITQEQPYTFNPSTGGYEYTLQFDAYYWRWQNKLLTYSMPGTNSAKETSFKLTAGIETHANVILRAINEHGYQYEGSPFRVDTTDTILSKEAKYIEYANLSILDAIMLLAETFECEWWVEKNAICFGKCVKSVAHDFIVGDNVQSISTSSTESHANRIYVFGSDRNIPANYRGIEDGDITEAVVEKRLMLPKEYPYLQLREDIPEDEIVEEVVVIEDVYPRTQLKIEDVPTYISSIIEDDGSTTTKTYYRVKYNSSFLFSNDYILPDEELHIIFTGGKLNGMDFAVEFNPLGVGEKKDDGSWNQEAQLLEIVVNEDYGRELPDGVLFPEKGDTFIMYGWDATKMESLGLVEDAEYELLEEAHKVLEEYRKDLTTYECIMMWDWCKRRKDSFDFPVEGTMVNLFFEEGSDPRPSRIIGYEYDYDTGYSNTRFTCGENVSTSRLKQLESTVEGLTHDGTKVQLQNSLDFLSKRYTDSTPFSLKAGGHIKAQQGFRAGNYVKGFAGASIDEKGNSEFESIESRSWLKVQELIYNRLNALEGNTSFADVGTIESVTHVDDGYQIATMRKRWDGDFTAFQEGDVVYGYVNNLGADHVEFSKSWAKVSSVDHKDNSLVLVLYPNSETPAGRNHPMTEGMIITRWGNATNRSRQSTFYISCEDGNIVQLMGVWKPILDKENYGTVMGRIPAGLLPPDVEKLINEDQPYLYLRGLLVQDIIRINYNGVNVRYPNYRGEWSEEIAKSSNEYYDITDYYYDAVKHRGILWRCLVAKTTAEPGTDAISWDKMTDTGMEDLSIWKIIPSSNVVTIRKGTITPSEISCTVTRTNAENTIESFDSNDLLMAKGVQLYFSLDGEKWEFFIFGSNEPIELEDGSGYLELEDGTPDDPYITIGGDNTPTSKIGDRITFQLRDIDTGIVLSQEEVFVVKDGEDGNPGKDGEDGKDGPIAYPAGEYSYFTKYESTSETTPVVLYENNYYCLKPNKSYIGSIGNNILPNNNPAYDVGNNVNPSWIRFDKFQAIFTEILFAEFAKLASGVFFGDWLISQQGTVNNKESFEYQRFKKENGGDFIPNFAVNFRTGEITAKNANIEGAVNATSGKFKGEVEASSGVFHGDIYADKGVFSGLVMHKETRITPGNFKDYCGEPIITQYPIGDNRPDIHTYMPDWTLCGPYIILEGNKKFGVSGIGYEERFEISLPHIFNDSSATNEQKENARRYVGVTICVYNYNTVESIVIGSSVQKHGVSNTVADGGGAITLAPGECAAFTCRLSCDSSSNESIFWEYYEKAKIRK